MKKTIRTNKKGIGLLQAPLVTTAMPLTRDGKVGTRVMMTTMSDYL
jgi:hypothetical protein